jgi:hypothetical protein
VDIKKFWVLAHKIILLTCTMLFCFAVATFGSGLAPLSLLTESVGAPSIGLAVNPWQALIPLLIFSFAIAVIFRHIIMRSRWHGMKLIIAIFITFYGLLTIVGQLESVVFLRNQMPEGLIFKIFLMGLILAALFSPLAVLILQKIKQETHEQTPNRRLVMPVTEWAWKVVVVGVSYVILYFIFGYFVAWTSPVIQTYYGGFDPRNFFSHIVSVWSSYPWLFLFQFARGLLWMLFALPVIRMYRGKNWQVGFTLALLFAFWSFQLLIPNPFIPPDVARVHLIETFSSNFIFGWIVGLLLSN